MGNVIDSEVVEMLFDNEQFAAGVKDTMNDLSKLKEALKKSESMEAFKGLDLAISNMRLDGIASGVDALRKRFTVLGLVGMKAVDNIAGSLFNMSKRLYDATVGGIVQGGIRRAMNLENAHFQLQALLKDETKVQAVMDDASAAVDGTAYSLDAAAKAASQFAASGVLATAEGGNMRNALRGIVGVAAMTNSEFEGIANIFTTVAGNGRLMGDQLLQLSSRGLNVASTIADFVNDVSSGSVEASTDVLTLVKSISSGGKVTEGTIRELTTKGQISFALFSEAMTAAFADSAERANETFTGSLSNIKSALGRIGAGFISPLIAQNSEVIKMFNATRMKINEFKNALVFDESVGNYRAASKQFSDYVLNIAGALSTFISSINTPVIMRNFYYGLESIKNIFKAITGIVIPLGKAFITAFSGPAADSIYLLFVILYKLTSGLLLTEGASEGLFEVFKSLFEIFGTLIGGIVKFISIGLIPFVQNTEDASSVLHGMTLGISQALKQFNSWLKTSPTVSKAFNIIGNAILLISKYIAVLGKGAINIGVKAFNEFGKALKALYDLAMSNEGIRAFVTNMIQWLNDLSDAFSMENIEAKIEHIQNAFTAFVNWIGSISSKMSSSNSSLGKIAAEFVGYIRGIAFGVQNANPALKTAIDTTHKILTFFGGIISSLFHAESFDDVVDILVNDGNRVYTFVKSVIGPIIDELSLSNIAAIGIGGGFLASFSKLANAFYILSMSMKNALTFQNVLSSTAKTLSAYQKNLQAGALIKIAGAIAILSGALVLLSFADPDRLVNASIAIGIAGGILFTAMSKLLNVVNRVRSVYDVINSLAVQVGKSVKWAALGSVIKSIGAALLMIVASIAAVVYLYNKHPNEMEKAIELIEKVALLMIAALGAFTLVGQKLNKGMRAFSAAALGVFALAASMTLIVSAVNKLFKMEIPTDYKQKLKILAGVMAGLSGMMVFVGLAGKISGGSKLSAMSIVGAAISLSLVVGALNKLFKIKLPYDYKTKMGIFTGVIVELGLLMIAIGTASKIAGGSIKAFGTIIAVCIFIGTVVGALMVLTIFDAKALMKGTVALGGILIALAGVLLAASKVSDVNTVKSIFAMTSLVASLVVALGILTLTPWDRMIAATAALGLILGSIAGTFYIVGNMRNQKILPSIASMSIAITALSIALNQLAKNSWDQMIAAGGALSLTILSLAGAMAIISKSTANVAAMGAFVLALGPMAAIAYALYQLSGQPWDGMLSAAASISLVLVAMAGTLQILTVVGAAAGPAVIGAGVLLLFISALTALMWGIGELVNNYDLLSSIETGLEVLQKIGTGLGNAIGNFINGVLGGLTRQLPQMGTDLSLFMANLQPFIVGCSAITQTGVLEGVGALANVILKLTGAGMIEGIANFVGGGSNIQKFGEQINELAPYLLEFGQSVAGMSESDIKGAALAGDIIAKLAASMPREGGWLDAILGTKKTLKDFGKELADFGPDLATFASDVSGITSDSVQGAADAGSIMASLAKNLPKSDGFAQQIFGDKTLSEFGDEIVPFGESIVEFARIVSGNVSGEAVQGAADAGSIMSKLADSLPNSGGLLATFFGDNNIDDFGDDLVSYGNSIVLFSEKVADLKPETISAAATMTEIMSKLADGLPNTKSVFSFLTGGTMDFKKFGEQLEKLGGSLLDYATSVEGINLGMINSSAESINNLMLMLTSLEGVDQYAMSNLALALSELPATAINESLTGFQNGQESLITAINNLYTVLGLTVQTNYKPLLDIVKSQVSSIATALTLHLSTPFGQTKDKMFEIGEQIINGLVSGMENHLDDVKTTAQMMANIIETITANTLEVNSPSRAMARLGAFCVAGLVNGLNNTKPVVDSTLDLAEAILQTYRKKMKIHSPAKETELDGYNTGAGYGVGIDKSQSVVGKATEDLVDFAKDSMDRRSEKAKAYEESKAKKDINELIYEVYPDWQSTVGKVVDDAVKVVAGGTEEVAEAQKTTGKKAHKEIIEEEKTYWDLLLDTKKNGAEASKYKDMKLVDFQKEVLEETTQVWKEYTDQLVSTRDSVMSEMDLFSEVEKQDGIKTKDQLKKNLEDQINLYREHAELLQNLRLRLGDDSDLSDYLASLGVDSYDQLKVINEMTDAELTNYANLYDTKLAYAENIAASQLTDLQKTTEDKLAEIFGGMSGIVDMYDFASVFDGTFESIDNFVSNIMLPLQQFQIEAARAAEELGPPIVAGFENAFDPDVIGNVMLNGINTAMEVVRQKETIIASNLGDELGGNLSDGISNTLLSNDFTTTAGTLMTNLVTALRNKGEIHSPSKLMEREVGTYLTEGIASGMINENSSTFLLNAIGEVLSIITSSFTENIDAMNQCGLAIGETIRNGMLTGITGFDEDVAELTKNTITELTTTWNEDDLFLIGSNIITFIQNGFIFVRQDFIDLVFALCEELIEMFKIELNEDVFNEIGKNIIIFTESGFKSKEQDLLDRAYQLCDLVIKTFRLYLTYQTFYDIGNWAMTGFENGLNSKWDDIQSATTAICTMVETSMRSALKVESPSKVAFEIGSYVSEGLALGISSNSSIVSEAGLEASNIVKDTIEYILDMINDEDFDPEIVITPVVDLSGVISGAEDVRRMFNTATMNISNRVIGVSSSFEHSNNARKASGNFDNGAKMKENNNSSYSFNQYNYSPKALSRIEIYRQTKNQFNQFKQFKEASK